MLPAYSGWVFHEAFYEQMVHKRAQKHRHYTYSLKPLAQKTANNRVWESQNQTGVLVSVK